jgi:signal transduction histidine kinase
MNEGSGVPRFSIALKIALLSWLVSLVTLLVFVLAIVPQQKRSFEADLASKARGLSASLQNVIAGAAVTEDYSAVVDQCRQVLQGDDSILYIVVTKNDGFSLIQQSAPGSGQPAGSPRTEPIWRQAKLGTYWHPDVRQATCGIGTVPLFGGRVFHYSTPFDYSGIHWGWIHLGLSLDAYDHSVAEVYRRTVILAVLCAALSLVFSLLYARRLVQPIRTLQTMLQRVSDGDLTARAAIASGDEVESLADSFNTMTSKLFQRDRILEGVRLTAQDFLFSEDWEQVIGPVLARLGQSTLAGRADLFVLNPSPGGGQRLHHRSGWIAPEIEAWWDRTECDLPAPEPGVLEELLDLARTRGLVSAPVQDLPAKVQNLLAPLRLWTLVLAPVTVAGAGWGFLTLGECRFERSWTDPEKDSLRALADMLGATVARHRTQAELLEAKSCLELRVTERTAELQEQMAAKVQAATELAEAQQQLIEVSRHAGMAEVATGVLHNVGNVLNSVNVSATLIREQLRSSEVATLLDLSALFRKHEHDLATFLAEDEAGREVLPFLHQLAVQIMDEHEQMRLEHEQLTTSIEHIKEIVNMQQNCAQVSGYLEQVSVPVLVDDALRINAASLQRRNVAIDKDYAEVEPIMVDKHKVLQILVNLIRNAGHALAGSAAAEKRLSLTVARRGSDRLAIVVRDNGIGITQENLTRIFSHGFSTKAGGHGFGLHSGALAAKEMGGALTVQSEGDGKGACFTLELPILEHLKDNRSER